MNKRFAVLPVALGAGSAMAQATDPATALVALQSFSGTTTGYGPVLFGLAVVATGIMIGVAWIKKARGAAKERGRHFRPGTGRGGAEAGQAGHRPPACRRPAAEAAARAEGRGEARGPAPHAAQIRDRSLAGPWPG